MVFRTSHDNAGKTGSKIVTNRLGHELEVSFCIIIIHDAHSWHVLNRIDRGGTTALGLVFIVFHLTLGVELKVSVNATLSDSRGTGYVPLSVQGISVSGLHTIFSLPRHGNTSDPGTA